MVTTDAVKIWNQYRISLQFEGEFGGQIPRSESEIKTMLEHRMPTRKPEGAVPIDELALEVASQVDVQDEDDEEYLPGWSTFKRNQKGALMYEGRCVRGHLKDCALQVKEFFPEIKNFRSKVVNRLYVNDTLIPIKDENGNTLVDIEDTEVRFIQVMTRQGPRSAIKYIDYVTNPAFDVTIKLLNDTRNPKTTRDIITIDHISAILEYGSVHGMGAERSQGWGRYTVTDITEL